MRKKQMHNKSAFTLAETLITMAIIGVVAALVIPVIMQKVQTHVWNEEKTNFEMKLQEAMNQMKTNEKLIDYATNDDFVNEFKKYIKINKTCSSANLQDCFKTSIITNDENEAVEVSALTTGTKIKAPNNTSDLVGINLINGVSALVAFDPTCSWLDPYDNQASAMGCLSMIYDLNGAKGPNKVNQDVRTINASVIGFDCTKVTGSNGQSYCYKVFLKGTYSAVNCSLANSGGADYKYCGNYPTGYTSDYWAGAIRACDKAGGRVPTDAELLNIFKYNYWPNLRGVAIGTSSNGNDSVWSSTDYGQDAIYNSVCKVAYGVYYNGSNEQKSYMCRNYTILHALCVK